MVGMFDNIGMNAGQQGVQEQGDRVAELLRKQAQSYQQEAQPGFMDVLGAMAKGYATAGQTGGGVQAFQQSLAGVGEKQRKERENIQKQLGAEYDYYKILKSEADAGNAKIDDLLTFGVDLVGQGNINPLVEQLQKTGKFDDPNISKMDVLMAAQQAGLKREPSAREVLELRKLQAETGKVEAEAEKTRREATLPKGGKGFKAAETEAAAFANRARAAADIAKDLDASEDFDPASTLGALRESLLPNQMQSDERQLYNQAAMDFVTAVLRKESGAAIGEEEFAREYRKYFPVAGDSTQVVKQKATARERAITNLIKQSQGAYESMFGAEMAAAAPAQTMMAEEAIQSFPTNQSFSQKAQEGEQFGQSYNLDF